MALGTPCSVETLTSCRLLPDLAVGCFFGMGVFLSFFFFLTENHCQITFLSGEEVDLRTMTFQEIKVYSTWASEMAQWLRVLTTPPEDPSSILSTHMQTKYPYT